jgi:hypothetical protein
MGLLDTLGLLAPAAAPGKPLTDKDFPTDAKHRKRDDADVARRAKQARGADATPDDGKGYDPGRKSREEELLTAVLDQALKDPKKRLEKLKELQVPRFSETYEDDTPESRFLADLKSGTKAAKEKLDYLKKVAEYIQKTGDLTQQKKLAAVGGDLGKIAKGVLGGIGTATKVIGKAQELREFYVALDQCATATSTLDLQDGPGTQAWVKSLQRLHDSTAPFKAWLMDKAISAALGGSELAGMAGAVLAIVGAQIFIGLKILEVGVAHVEGGGRNTRRAANISRGGDGTLPEDRPPPPPPDPPAEWKSRAEMADDARRLEDTQARKAIQGKLDAIRRKQRDSEAARERAFEDSVFPKAYIAWRPSLLKDVLATLRAENAPGAPGRSRASAASQWWDCFLLDGASRFDAQAGIDLAPPKLKLDVDEAQIEIGNFQTLGQRCPKFDAFEQGERTRYQKTAARQP